MNEESKNGISYTVALIDISMDLFSTPRGAIEKADKPFAGFTITYYSFT